jgi:formylmethanofuran dehydrogenase subunit B
MPPATDAAACANVFVFATIPTCTRVMERRWKNEDHVTVLLGPNAAGSMPRKLTAATSYKKLLRDFACINKPNQHKLPQ